MSKKRVGFGAGVGLEEVRFVLKGCRILWPGFGVWGVK